MSKKWVGLVSTLLCICLVACTTPASRQPSQVARPVEECGESAASMGPGLRVLARLTHPHEQIIETAGHAALLRTAGGLEVLTYQAGQLIIEPVLAGTPPGLAWDGERLIVQEPAHSVLMERTPGGKWVREQELPPTRGGIALHGRWLLLGDTISETDEVSTDLPVPPGHPNAVRIYLRRSDRYALAATLAAPYSGLNTSFGGRVWVYNGIAVISAYEQDNPRQYEGQRGHVTCGDAGYVYDLRVSPPRELARLPCSVLAVSKHNILTEGSEVGLQMWRVGGSDVIPLVGSQGVLLGSFSEQGFVITNGQEPSPTARWLLPTADGWQASTRFTPPSGARFHAALGVMFVADGDELLALGSH